MIIFHQRTTKIHEEMREKEEMQDSLSFFQYLSKISPNHQRSSQVKMIFESRRLNGEILDQKYKPMVKIHCFRPRSVIFRPKELEHDQFAPRTSCTRREVHKASVRAANSILRAAYASHTATCSDLMVQVFSKLNLISLITFNVGMLV